MFRDNTDCLPRQIKDKHVVQGIHWWLKAKYNDHLILKSWCYLIVCELSILLLEAIHSLRTGVSETEVILRKSQQHKSTSLKAIFFFDDNGVDLKVYIQSHKSVHF